MIYGYARVSTKKQERDGNSLADQETKLAENGCEEIYHDSYTGTKMDRPELTKLLNKLVSGDRLVVTKLDRFARTTAGGIETIQGLLSRGVSVHILNMGLIDNTPAGKLMVAMLLAIAEFERDMIVERTSMGKSVAKASNAEWKDGRKKKEVDMGELKRLRTQVRRRNKTVDECCKQLGISRGTWYNLLKEIA